MIRYAITSRARYPGSEHEKQAALLAEASRWVAEGINFIQLREKDHPASEQADLARKILEAINLSSGLTKLLINSRSDIALATGAHGVHLTGSPDELTPAQVRALYAVADREQPTITISCHTLADVQLACQNKVDAILFSPVFEKPLPDAPPIPGQSLDQLKAACSFASPTPVYALGGVTLQNASSCLAVGAAGIAGIRLFQSAVTAK
jgi:thiamine-phosphate pyrophosphorylase